MDRNRVTVRYAKALFELALEQNILDQVNGDIRILFTTLDQMKSFANFISNPEHTSNVKYESIKSTFGNQFHGLTLKFLMLVFDKHRDEYLKDICRNFIEMERKEKGIVTANLKTAATIDDKLIDRLKTKFENKIEAKIELTTEIDPELLGGFIFTIDGQQYDASIASTLQTISTQLQLK